MPQFFGETLKNSALELNYWALSKAAALRNLSHFFMGTVVCFLSLKKNEKAVGPHCLILA